MNNLDDPKVLPENNWQVVENSFPGNVGKPRNGINELMVSTAELGYGSIPTTFRPHATSMKDPTGKVWLFAITEGVGDSFPSEYAIELWDTVLQTRTVLESFQLSNTLCFFGFEKIYGGLYVVFD